MHTVFALLCFVVVIHWLIFQYPSGLLHWHWGNLTIAPVPAKQPWWIWINTSCSFIMNDCITTTKQSTTNPCAYFLGYTVDTRNVTYPYGDIHTWKTGPQLFASPVNTNRCVQFAEYGSMSPMARDCNCTWHLNIEKRHRDRHILRCI